MASSTVPTIWWVRRDFRLADNPALRAAVDAGVAVLPLFVLDPNLLGSAGTARRAWLYAALHQLDVELREAGGPGLSVVSGRPVEVVPPVAATQEAKRVVFPNPAGAMSRSRGTERHSSILVRRRLRGRRRPQRGGAASGRGATAMRTTGDPISD